MGNNCVPAKGTEEGILGSISNSLGLSQSKSETSETSTNYKSDIDSQSTQEEAPEVVKIGTKHKVSAGVQAEYIIKKEKGKVKEHFKMGKKLGDGQYGTTFCCVEKATGKKYACKSISKQSLVAQMDVDCFRREMEIMNCLSGKPNVISIKDCYEDVKAVHIIMELCAGGELLDRLVKLGNYSERKAAELARIIVGVVQTCHSLGVIHRDLKPENFLFINDDNDSPIKTIDFGMSVFFKKGQLLTDMVGTPYYVAPEVLLKSYGPEADIWSAGVILYIILSGAPPFCGETQQEICNSILHGNIDFLSNPWPEVSDGAKDLVRKMLERDPKKRIKANDILRHPWVQINGAPDKPMDPAVFSRLKQFSGVDKLKRMAQKVIAQNLSEEEISGLNEMFKMMDPDDNTQITLEELKEGMKLFEANLNEAEMKSLIRAVEFDNNGTIDYEGFFESMLHIHQIQKDDLLQAAFSFLDKDGSGYISRDELQKACKQFGVDAAGLGKMLQEADQNNDGQIDYQEFVIAMQKAF